jgi:hypothetical protein
MTVTITLAGVRGGQGTSTTAAALALLAARRTERVELVAHDIDTMAALIGVPTPADPERGVAITEQLTLRSEPSKTAQVVMIDAGPLQGLTTHPDGLLLAVLRGPCYLSLRAAITGPAPTADGIIVVREHGRSLTERDVTDVTGIATLAETVASPAVARTIDAGVLAARVQRLTDLAPLDHWLKKALAPPTESARTSTVTEHPRAARSETARIDTDLPVALSATGRERRSVAFGVRDAHRRCRVEHRQAGSRSGRVLRRGSRVLS